MTETRRPAVTTSFRPPAWTPARKLTPAQFRVVALLFHEECDYAGVASRLSISVRTVKQHVESVARWLPGNGFPAWKVLRYAERLLEAGCDGDPA